MEILLYLMFFGKFWFEKEKTSYTNFAFTFTAKELIHHDLTESQSGDFFWRSTVRAEVKKYRNVGRFLKSEFIILPLMNMYLVLEIRENWGNPTYIIIRFFLFQSYRNAGIWIKDSKYSISIFRQNIKQKKKS